MDGRKIPDKRNEFLEVDGETYIEDKGKAEQFGKTYRQFSKLTARRSDRELKKRLRKRLNGKEGEPDKSKQDIKMQELQRAIPYLPK